MEELKQPGTPNLGQSKSISSMRKMQQEKSKMSARMSQDFEHQAAQLEQLKHLQQGVNTGSQSVLKSYLDPTERPQTADALKKIEDQNKQGQITVQVPLGNPSTAASSNQQDPLISRGFGELGSTKKTMAKAAQIEKAFEEEIYENQQESDDSNEQVTCPNCKEEMRLADAPEHTVKCMKASTKCKICGEIIFKVKKKEHLAYWRNEQNLQQALMKGYEEKVSLHFDHGMNVNMQFNQEKKETTEKDQMNQSTTSLSKIPLPDAMNQNRDKWTPMHFVAENGSLEVTLALVSRGAGIDPTDEFERTPLMIAIENTKLTVAKTLIEFGADIENTDIYGKTPLMYACKSGSKEIVEQLINCKVDINAVNKIGDSAVTMAQKSNNQDITMLLVKNGGSIRPNTRQKMAALEQK